jgi:hypothetical protein
VSSACVSPNKQLQRTVTRCRGDGERAISLCARAALHTAARGLNCGVMRHDRRRGGIVRRAPATRRASGSVDSP